MAVIAMASEPCPTPTAANLSQSLRSRPEVVTIKATNVDEYLPVIIIAPPQANRRGFTTGKTGSAWRFCPFLLVGIPGKVTGRSSKNPSGSIGESVAPTPETTSGALCCSLNKSVYKLRVYPHIIVERIRRLAYLLPAPLHCCLSQSQILLVRTMRARIVGSDGTQLTHPLRHCLPALTRSGGYLIFFFLMKRKNSLLNACVRPL